MFTEDLSVFFRTADHGTAAQYNGGATINGIFGKPYLGALEDLADGSNPTFTCAAADVPAAAQGDTLVIGAETYKVRDVQPDGTGVVTLQLEKQ